jgi:hypothetical protein
MGATQTASPGTPDKEAYAEAMQMLRYEGTMLWQRFSAFLIAHGLFTALLSHAILDGRSRSWLVVAGCLAGVLLCVVWLSTFARGNAFFDLRVAQATRFEATEWGIIGGTGKTFSEGGRVTSGTGTRRMPLIGRWRMRHMVYVAISILALAYIALGFVALAGSVS